MQLTNPPVRLTSQLSRIPSGEAGTLVTLKVMRQLVRSGKKSLPIRTLAVQLTNGLRQKDWLGEAKALHAFVRDKVRYVKDVRGVETLHDPVTLLRMGAGDCDDKSVLVASLLESINHPTRFVAIGFRPGHFAHVYVETRIGTSWVAVETTEPVPLGWAAPDVESRMVVHN